MSKTSKLSKAEKRQLKQEVKKASRIKKQEKKKQKSKGKLSSFVPALPKTPQQVMNALFIDYNEQTNIFRVEEDIYSICFEYSDISFTNASDEEAENIFFKWLDYLHSFREVSHIQVLRAGTPISTKDYKKGFLFNVPQEEGLAPKQVAEELNSLMDASLGTGEETLITKRYVVISQKATSYDQAYTSFLNVQVKTEEKFKELGSTITVTTIKDRLHFIHDFYNVNSLHKKDIIDILDYVKEKDVTIYDALSPSKISFRESDYVEISEESGSKFLRVLYTAKLPKSITPRFYNRITNLEDVQLITTLNIQPTNPAKMIKKIEKRLSGVISERFTKVKRFAKQQISYEYVRDEKLETKIANAQQLMRDFQKNDQRLFRNNMLICIIADNYKELEEATVKVKDISSEFLVDVRNIKVQQMEAIQNLLPLGLNTLQFQRTLSSEATAVNVPFSSNDYLHKNAIYHGINLVSKNAIFCDRKKQINGNGAILATSGSGKSFTVKTMMEQIALRYPDDDILVIDFQKEYRNLIKEFGGQELSISTTADTHINPFDLDVNYGLNEEGKANPVGSKSEFLLAFIESMLSERSLSPEEKTIIDRCVLIAFEKYEASGFKDETLLPTLPKFKEILEQQKEPEAEKLSLTLERFVSGSLDIFAKKSNIDIHSKLVSFDISELPTSLQTTGYLVILDHIMNRLAKNQSLGRNTWVFIDEFHILLSNLFSAEYVAKFYKIGRKYNALLTIITQNISEVLDNRFGKEILSVSEFLMILKQKRPQLKRLAELFNLSEDEVRYITGNVPTGQGLIVYNDDKIPFLNKVPKGTKMYDLNNTDKIATAR